MKIVHNNEEHQNRRTSHKNENTILIMSSSNVDYIYGLASAIKRPFIISTNGKLHGKIHNDTSILDRTWNFFFCMEILLFAWRFCCLHEDDEDLLLFHNIKNSDIYSITTRPTILQYNGILRWIFDHIVLWAHSMFNVVEFL